MPVKGGSERTMTKANGIGPSSQAVKKSAPLRLRMGWHDKAALT
jgi:hypothetical protein